MVAFVLVGSQRVSADYRWLKETGDLCYRRLKGGYSSCRLNGRGSGRGFSGRKCGCAKRCWKQSSFWLSAKVQLN